MTASSAPPHSQGRSPAPLRVHWHTRPGLYLITDMPYLSTTIRRWMRFNYWVTCPLDTDSTNSVSRIVEPAPASAALELRRITVTPLRPSGEYNARLDQKENMASL